MKRFAKHAWLHLAVVLAVLSAFQTSCSSNMKGAAHQSSLPKANPLGSNAKTNATLTAFDLVTQRATAGDVQAQVVLGLMYAKGEGTKKNLWLASRWFRRAAESGDMMGQYFVALYFYDGEGFDFREAALWYRKAAEQGLADAQYKLGEMYGQGRGVTEDQDEAIKWFRKAMEQGLKLASSKLAKALERKKVKEYYALHPEKRLEGMPSFRESQGYAPAPNYSPRRRADGITPRTEPSVGSVSSGTGFFVGDDGYVVTCEHVVRGATSFHVRSSNGWLPAELINTDRAIDVALLKVDGTFQALPVSPEPHVNLGDAVFTIGFPNPGVQGIEPKLTRGEISSKAGIRDNPRYYQISVPVQPGNSGGALVDEYGNAVGVVTARLDDVATYEMSGALPQNVNYAVKGSLVRDFLNKMPELSGRLKAPRTTRNREAASAAAERAAVLVVAE